MSQENSHLAKFCLRMRGGTYLAMLSDRREHGMFFLRNKCLEANTSTGSTYYTCDVQCNLFSILEYRWIAVEG